MCSLNCAKKFNVYSLSDSIGGCGEYDDYCWYFLTTMSDEEFKKAMKDYASTNYEGNSPKEFLKSFFNSMTDKGILIHSSRSTSLDITSDLIDGEFDLDHLTETDICSPETIAQIQQRRIDREKAAAEKRWLDQLEKQRQDAERKERDERATYERLKTKYEKKGN